MRDDLIVEPPRVARAGEEYVAEARVAGVPLWFRTRDAALAARSEAWGTCLLIPAQQRARRLRLVTPVCPTWAAGADRALELTSRWWPSAAAWPSLEVDDRPAERARGIGLCFTAGVDSLFSLLRYPGRIDTLVHLTHADDAGRAEAPLRRIGAERGMRVVVIASNLKQHPAFRGAPWGRTHGAALAALGHLLSDELGMLVLSSSYPYAYAPPWGSHHELDPLWSSARLTIEHFGATHWRTQKLIEIAGEPIVQAHLNPCSKRSGRLNCCRCEKCLRTQLVLLACGRLERFKVFDGAATLAEQADNVARIPIAGLFPVYERLLEDGLPTDIAAAVRRLLDRSRRALRRRAWAAAALRLVGWARRVPQEAS